MKVLVIGGSGLVGSLVLPYLKQRHTLKVFDLKPPAHLDVEYVHGSVLDYETVKAAAVGMDAVQYMVMGMLSGPEIQYAESVFDLNVKGVFMALHAARTAGVTHAVHCSSMSVYDGALDTRYFFDEDMPPDARGVYGITKRMGEEVCRNAWVLHGMSVNALRLCLPTPRDKWLAQARIGKPWIATEAEDVAGAMLGALEYRNGFQAFMISGDYENKIMNMSKARRLLNWEPLARPVQS